MQQAIDQNLCCPQESYFADECPIFVGFLSRKGRCRKVTSFMEEFPIVQRSLLLIQQQDHDIITKFGSQKTTPTMLKSSTLFSTTFRP